MTDDTKADLTYGFEGNSPLTVAARAGYGAMVACVREHAASLDFQPDRLRRVFRAASIEADRSAAILMFALAEDLMLESIKRYCCSGVKGGWEEVSGGNGLLATANDRITFLCLLGWIKSSVYSDLRLMKSIRNRFAHQADIEGFDDSRVSSWVSAMTKLEKVPLSAVSEVDLPRPEKFSVRQLFLMRSASTIIELVANLAVAPRAQASMVAPGHVLQGDWELCPASIKELFRISAEVVTAVCKGA